MRSSEADVGIRGALAVTIGIGRVLGLCPLAAAPPARVSRALTLCSCCLLLPVYNLACCWGFYGIYSNSQSTKAALVKIFGLFPYTVLLNIAVLTANRRLHALLKCLRTLEEIVKINIEKSCKKEQRWGALFIIYFLASNWVIFCFNLYICLNSLWKCSSNYYFSIALYVDICFSVLSCASFQFIFVCARIYEAIVVINSKLTKLYRYKNKKKQISRNNFFTGPPCDREFLQMPSSVVAARIRSLARSYVSVCSVIDNFISSEGLVVLLIVFGSATRLMVTVYDAFSFENDTAYFRKLFIETFMASKEIVKLLLVCEICHRTQEQMNRTSDLIQGLAEAFPNDVEVTNELNQFSQDWELLTPIFSPLGYLILDRILVIKILGYVATYLIAILQLENKYCHGKYIHK